MPGRPRAYALTPKAIAYLDAFPLPANEALCVDCWRFVWLVLSTGCIAHHRTADGMCPGSGMGPRQVLR